MIYVLIFINVLLLVSGQILWKHGLNKIGALNAGNWTGVLTSWPVWAGLLLYVVATFLWFIVLSRTRLSLAYPLQSVAYILGMLAGVWLFGEKVSWLGWAGGFLIISGVTLISLPVK